MRSETDWDRVDRMSEQELEAAACEDPDNPPMDEEFLSGEWERGDLSKATKVPVTIRLDPEVVAFFQRPERKGYQKRINAVLRAYIRGRIESKGGRPRT